MSKRYATAAVYAQTLIFSTLYHACTEAKETCLLFNWQTLQMLDFIYSMVSLPMTANYVLQMPEKWARIINSLSLAAITGLVFVGSTSGHSPSVTFEKVIYVYIFVALMPLIRCLTQLSQRRASEPVRDCLMSCPWPPWNKRYLACGIMLALAGLGCKIRGDTGDYETYHSLWHLFIQSSTWFFQRSVKAEVEALPI